MSEIVKVNIEDLQDTWALRGHPTLLRRRWQRVGVNVDSDESVEAFCATADGPDAIHLLVDLSSMSEEPELNRRADIAAKRVCECYPDDEVTT